MELKGKYFNGYKKSQYEDYSGGEFFGGEIVNARYIEQQDESMRGNILIEALPPVEESEDIMRNFTKKPEYSEDERKENSRYRVQAIYRLSNYMFPFLKNIEVERLINSTIRNGYSSKFVMTPEHIKNLEKYSSCLTSEYLKNNLKETTCKSKIASNALNGFIIMGISGGGKTTAVNNTLTRIPQVIQHTGYGEDKFLFTQITWIKIDCSYNGSLKGICQKVFFEIDKLLGTNYNKMHGGKGKGVDSMITAISFLAQKYAIGALIIDELQHLKSNRGEESLNFFVSLMNEIKMPIISIGTYKIAKMVLGKDFRHCRRITGMEGVEWTNIPKNYEWETLIEDLWKYQWTREYTELTDEIKDLLYEKTLGITDFVIKIFMACQIKAITSGKEKITPALIENIAKRKFTLPSDMIKALRENDIEKLSTFEDMSSPSIKEMIDNAFKIQNIQDFQERRNKILKEKTSSVEEVKQKLHSMLICFGYKEVDESKAISLAIRKLGIDESSEKLLQEVVKILSYEESESNSSTESQKNNSKRKSKISDDEAKEFVDSYTLKDPMI